MGLHIGICKASGYTKPKLNGTIFIILSCLYIQGLAQIDTLSILRNRRQELIKMHFPFASIDTLSTQNGIIYLLDSGDHIKSISYEVFCSDKLILKQKRSNIAKVKEDIIHFLEEKYSEGYIESEMMIHNVAKLDKNFHIVFKFQTGKQFDIDSIEFIQDPYFIYEHIIRRLILPEDNSKVKLSSAKIISLLRGISYIQIDGIPLIERKDTIHVMKIRIKERKINQFYGILGILSDAYGSNDLKITGEANISLQNLFRRGISGEVKWQSNRESSQFLNLQSSIPCILNTQIGLSSKFNLEKIDTQFLRIGFDLGLAYHFSSQSSLSFQYRNTSSSIIQFNKSEVFSGKLPNFLDLNSHQFGLTFNFQNLDKPIFSKSGTQLQVECMVGQNSIIKNQKIEELKDNQGNSLGRLYDSLKLEQNILTWSISFNSHHSINRRIVLKPSVLSKAIIADPVRTNQMYFVGGVNGPRGFDENQFLTPLFITFSQEFQYYISEYFYSNIFADMTQIQRTETPHHFNQLFGFGAGMTLRLTGSILRLNLASGISENQSFSLNQTKFHFSYVGLF